MNQQSVVTQHYTPVNSTNYKQHLHPLNVSLYEMADRVYKIMGPGHTEFIYHRAMEIELRDRGVNYDTERRVLITYQDNSGFRHNLGEERIDLFLVKEQTIVELKAIINPPKECELAQVHKYHRELIKLGEKPKFGIIINFPQPGVKAANTEIDFYEIIF